MKFFNDIINEISREELDKYYNQENHSWNECMEHWGISGSLLTRLLKYYNIKKSKENHNKKIAETKLRKYGSSTYNNRDQAKQTCLERYGVENPFQDVEHIKQSYVEAFGDDHPMHNEAIVNKFKEHHDAKSAIQKGRQTYLERTGFDNPGKNPDVIKKGIETKIAKGYYNSPGTSNIERRLEKILNRNFETVIWHYRDPRYARSTGYQFETDFYIKELDLFIELNAADFHHNCPFDPLNEDHIKLSNTLKCSTKKWNQKKYETWCIRDREKQLIAKENNLNYIQLYPNNSIFNNQQFNDQKYAKLISFLIKKLNKK